MLHLFAGSGDMLRGGHATLAVRERGVPKGGIMNNKYFSCRDCGAQVVWATSKAGKNYLSEPWTWTDDESGTHQKVIPLGHKCKPNPQWKEDAAVIVAAQFEADLAAGNIVKQAPVVVFKGRKIPVGTTGIVTWIGEDNWGAARVGILTESGEVVYTAQANVKINQKEEAK